MAGSTKRQFAYLFAATSVVKEYGPALMCGTADPADPEVGLDAFNAALAEAGIDAIIAEIQTQYDDWKAAQ